jgi:hypothetical protein
MPTRCTDPKAVNGASGTTPPDVMHLGEFALLQEVALDLLRK